MTASLEDYLEMVSFLADEGNVRVTDLALRLGFSKPSVITAVKTLEAQGLLEHERYGCIQLTEKGEQRAYEIRGRHNFLKDFLHETIGVSYETSEKDACKMEHILSEETLQKFKEFEECRKNCKFL
jgi:DtxR family Mn-dependent transcriptional regulator